MNDSNDWEAAGKAFLARRKSLGMKQVDVSRRSGVSDVTIRKTERGEPWSRDPVILANLALAVDWPHDQLQRIAAGEPVSSPVAGTGSPDLERRVAALERDVSGILRILEVTGAMQEAATNVLEPEPPVQEGAQ
jgi:transcriptional regulator with XRE-family HTH domain